MRNETDRLITSWEAQLHVLGAYLWQVKLGHFYHVIVVPSPQIKRLQPSGLVPCVFRLREPQLHTFGSVKSKGFGGPYMPRQLTQKPSHGLDVGRRSAHVFQVLQIQGNEAVKGLGVNKVQAFAGPPDLH